jgi:hypothetical protein
LGKIVFCHLKRRFPIETAQGLPTLVAMSSTAQAFVNTPNQGPALSAMGVIYRFFASRQQTGGAYILSEPACSRLAENTHAGFRLPDFRNQRNDLATFHEPARQNRHH